MSVGVEYVGMESGTSRGRAGYRLLLAWRLNPQRGSPGQPRRIEVARIGTGQLVQHVQDTYTKAEY